MTASGSKKGKLTLRDLAAIEVKQSVAPTPSEDVDPGEAAPELDTTEYLPDGVSSDVAQLLGMPSRQEAERAAAEKARAEREAAEKAAREAAEAKRRAEEERIALEKARAEAEAAERARVEAAARRRRVLSVVGAIALVAAIAVAVVFAMQPPPVDETPYAGTDAVTTVDPEAPVASVAFVAIPEPPPAEEVEEEAAPRREAPRRRPTREIRRSDLF